MKIDKYVIIFFILFIFVWASMNSTYSAMYSSNQETFSEKMEKLAEQAEKDAESDRETSEEYDSKAYKDVDKVVVGDKGIEKITYSDDEPEKAEEVVETKEDKRVSQPAAPVGYEWEQCVGMKAEFLKPEEWFFKEESSSSGNPACFISKERITSTQGFETGLSINAIQNVSDATATAPSVYMEAYMDKIAESFDDVEPYDRLNEASGTFMGLASTMSKQDITVYYLLYYNTKSDTLYVISFESPNKTWKESWKIGTVLLEKLGFSASF
jgi:hypothetical protein